MGSVETEHAFQVFVKPVGARCNLRCSYCYYLDKREIYPQEKTFVMPDHILERFIAQNIEASADNTINFSWHGGEPLLAGIGFFRKAIEMQKKYMPAGRSILNGVQTNGTLIDSKWCSFFSENGFSIGISIDGPAGMHDTNRITGNGNKTSDKVLRGYEMLRNHNIPTEILCVVNSGNVRQPLVVYNFFKHLGARYITFLPLVNRMAGSVMGVTPDSVPSLDYGVFLSKIFDEWVEKDIGRISIQVFE
ncbi:MAG: radical SAM protein [Bacteroidales bacterium]